MEWDRWPYPIDFFLTMAHIVAFGLNILILYTDKDG